jgi:uncharacterized protein YndB with AHSA1/START domain
MTASDDPQVTTEGEGVVVERVLDAPRELVWRAWTECEHFMRWYGPKGMSSHVCEIDFRVGGRHLYGLRSPEGWEYYTTGVYQEIVPLERFVTTDSLADADGNLVPPAHYGMPEDSPSETTVIVSVEDIDGGKTKLTLRQIGWADADMAQGAGGGWNEAFDKLEATLVDMK